MTPVKQSKLYQADGIHNGNCFAACLASLLDLPLWMVPPFEDMFARNDWRHRIDEYLKRVHGLRMRREVGHPTEGLPQFYIANGLSPRGVYHSVIYSAGQLAHDPHFSNAGISAVEWCWLLEPIPSEASA